MIFTLPNIVSFIRICLVPLFLWLLFGRDDPAAAGLLIGFVGATDWVDGFLARRLGQVSEVGKFLDPLADRLAIAAAVIGGWVAGVLPPWFAAAILVREALVATGALLIAVRAHAKLDVRRFGKVATFSLYFAIPAFFVHSGGWHDFFESFAWVTGGVGLVLYWWVAAQYTRDMVAILRGASPAVSSSGQGDAT
ncbi:MAG: CDP-alcohol phosphatidyltransferase family protein [Actinomycetota bacterium]